MTEEYEQGKRDEKLSNIGKIVDGHKNEFIEIRRTIKSQERVIWMIIGAFGLVQFLPEVKKAFGL